MTLDYLALLMQGLAVTALLAALGTLLAAGLGLPLAIALRSGRVALVTPARLYVELMRGVPLVLLLFLLYYGGPSLGFRLPASWAGVLGLGLFGAGSFAEIYRAGLAGVPTGELEAARMLGLQRGQAFLQIELPRALRLIVPPIGGQVIVMVKESAVLSIITVAELSKRAGELSSISFSIAPLVVAALLYWVLVEMIARTSFLIEARLSAKDIL